MSRNYSRAPYQEPRTFKTPRGRGLNALALKKQMLRKAFDNGWGSRTPVRIYLPEELIANDPYQPMVEREGWELWSSVGDCMGEDWPGEQFQVPHAPSTWYSFSWSRGRYPDIEWDDNFTEEQAKQQIRYVEWDHRVTYGLLRHTEYPTESPYFGRSTPEMKSRWEAFWAQRDAEILAIREGFHPVVQALWEEPGSKAAQSWVKDGFPVTTFSCKRTYARQEADYLRRFLRHARQHGVEPRIEVG